MRDGVKLFTSGLVAKDASTTYPFLFVQSPFGVGPYGPDEYSPARLHSDALLRAGYIWVQQDVRGRRMAEGEFSHTTPHRPEKRIEADVGENTDTHETIEMAVAARTPSQRSRGHLEHFVRGLLHGGWNHRHTSGDQSGVAAGAGRRSFSQRRLVSRGAFMLGAKGTGTQIG
jgi:hypothetical protein